MDNCCNGEDNQVELSIVILVDEENNNGCGGQPQIKCSQRPATPCAPPAEECPCCCRPKTPPCSRPGTPNPRASCSSSKIVIPISVGKPVCQGAEQDCGCPPPINPPRIIPTGSCCCASLFQQSLAQGPCASAQPSPCQAAAQPCQTSIPCQASTPSQTSVPCQASQPISVPCQVTATSSQAVITQTCSSTQVAIQAGGAVTCSQASTQVCAQAGMQAATQVATQAAPLPCRTKSQTTACQTVAQVSYPSGMQPGRTASASATQAGSSSGAKKPCLKKKTCGKKSPKKGKTKPPPQMQMQAGSQVVSVPPGQQVCAPAPPVCAPAPPVCAPAPPVCGPGDQAGLMQEVEKSSEAPSKTKKKKKARSRESKRSKESRKSKGSRKSEESKEERRERKRSKRRSSDKSERSSKRTSRKRRSKPLIAPEDLNFAMVPKVPLTYVDHFLKADGGVDYVIKLSMTKRKYEKKCKKIIASLSEVSRESAEQFFMRIVDSIQVKFPDGNSTEVKHFQLPKYVSPILNDMKLNAEEEYRSIHKYHKYICSVSDYMEMRLSERKPIAPEALVDIDTYLLAGIVSRFYPVFLRLKNLLVQLSKKTTGPTPSDYVKDVRKLILTMYVEIAAIDVTFNNIMTSLSVFPNVEAQENFRQKLKLRRAHARHSVMWAARCVATSVLFYYLQRGDVDE